MRKVLLFAVLLPLVASCMKDDYVDYTAVDEQKISDYLAQNNIDAERDASGVYYKIIDKGTGEPIDANASDGDVITFSYKGSLLSGSVFADTKGENITQNLWYILPGMQFGLPKINREGEIILYIPSGLAYGSSGANGVPANSVVIFEIKVDRDQADIDEDIIAAYLAENQITAERDESGLYYVIHEEGEGNNVPASAYIDATYKGMLLNGDVFDEGTISNSPLAGLIEAWRVGVPKLKKGSKATFYCPSQMAYGHIPQYNNKNEETIPANSILVFDIEVVNF